MEINKVTTKFKWFWVWQDKAEEAWLEKMSQKGYHLSSVSPLGFYTFITGEPQKYAYRLDYQTFRKKDRDEYLQLFRDAGWEYIGDMTNWQYFRKKYDSEETPEIFTDTESKISMYKRVLAYLCFFYTILGVIFGGRITGSSPYPLLSIVQAIILLVLLLLTYAIIRLAIRIRRLRKSVKL